jgi:cellulose 1,4-beta-cellobiosidase
VSFTARRVLELHADNDNSEKISQYFVQGGKKFEMPESKYAEGHNSITTEFCEAAKAAFGDSPKFADMGGLPQMGDAVGKPMVLVMSLWDDGYSNMLWLDSAYPLDKDESEPGVARGSCARESGKPDDVRKSAASAKVVFSNIKFGPIGSTY